MKRALMKRRIPERALMWLCVAALLLSLMPLYALSFYNHACYDDFGYTIRTHAVWLETGSVLETLREAVQNTIDTRRTWEGNYASTFLNAIQPALFGENLYWLTTVILITFFLISLWFFLKQVLVRELHADSTAFWMSFSAVALVMMQLVPELSEAFFWYAGGIAYTFLWSAMLLRIGLWLCFDRAQKPAAQAALYVLLLGMTLVVGGAKFSTLLFAALADGLLLVRAFREKRPCRWAELLSTVVLLVCFAFCAASPGNLVRAETLHSTVSAPAAVLQAFYFGVALMGSWFSLPLFVVWAMVAWQLAEALRGSPYRFNHPIWTTILSVCLFCAQLAPTLVTGNYLGDGRALNSYFYTFVLMGCVLALYWLGWWLRRTEGRPSFPAIGTAKRDGLRIGIFAVVIALVVIGCVSYHPEGSEDYGPLNMASGSALRSLLSGEAAEYDAAMDERDEALNDPDQTEPVLRPVETIPDAFMGDALNGEDRDYVLNLYAEYYGKQNVTVAEEE